MPFPCSFVFAIGSEFRHRNKAAQKLMEVTSIFFSHHSFSPSIYEDEHEQNAGGNYMVCASCNSFRLVCLYKYFIKKASQETEIIETLI